MSKHQLLKLLRRANKSRILQLAFKVYDRCGGVLQSKGIIITLHFVYIVRKWVLYDISG